MKRFSFIPLLFILFQLCPNITFSQSGKNSITEEKLVQELFQLRNEHKAEAAEQYYANTVKVYMKYLRNIPRKRITASDKEFWKNHPNNKFEITKPLQVKKEGSGTTVIIYGKEYLDGTSFKYEKIEIKFNPAKKIYHYRGYNWNGKL